MLVVLYISKQLSNLVRLQELEIRLKPASHTIQPDLGLVPLASSLFSSVASPRGRERTRHYHHRQVRILEYNKICKVQVCNISSSKRLHNNCTPICIAHVSLQYNVVSFSFFLPGSRALGDSALE